MAVTPVARPTEWVSAVSGIIVAVLLYVNDRDFAALVMTITAFVPAIVTAIVVALGGPAPSEPTLPGDANSTVVDE